MMKQPLEKYRIFPYIAWAVFLSFAFFVWHLTRELSVTQNDFEASTARLEERARMDPLQITDFDR